MSLGGPLEAGGVRPPAREPAPRARGRAERWRRLAWPVALGPCTLAGVWLFGLRVLAMVAVSWGAMTAVQVVFAAFRRRPLAPRGLIAAWLFALVLPPAIPLWMAALGAAFAAAVGVELFGGPGRHLFNVPALGRCFLTLSYPQAMSGSFLLPGGGPLGRLGQYVGPGAADAVAAATPLASGPAGPFDLLHLALGNVPGSAGETSALAILAGGLLLVAAGTIPWRIPLAMLGSFALAALLLGGGSPDRFIAPLWHLLAGGVLLTAFFLASDAPTAPAAPAGQWVYGALVGAVTMLIRRFGGHPEGAAFAVLLGNVTAPLIDSMLGRPAAEGQP